MPTVALANGIWIGNAALVRLAIPPRTLAVPVTDQLKHLGAQRASALLIVGLHNAPAFHREEERFAQRYPTKQEVCSVLSGALEFVPHLLIRAVLNVAPMLDVRFVSDTLAPLQDVLISANVTKLEGQAFGCLATFNSQSIKLKREMCTLYARTPDQVWAKSHTVVQQVVTKFVQAVVAKKPKVD